MKIGRSRTLQSAKYLEQRRKKNIFAGIVLFACIFIVLSLVVFIFRLDTLQISTIGFSGVSNISIEELEQKVIESMQGNYLFLIPKSNIVFYSKDKIKNKLIESFKEFDSVSVKSSGLSSVIVSIVERRPNAIVCNGFKDDSLDNFENDNCLNVDSNGYVYSKVNEKDNNDYPRYYLSSDSLISIGESLLNKEKFINLKSFVNDIKVSGISVKGILIGDDGSYELYFKNFDGSTAVIYFDDKTPLTNTSSNFIAFWNASSKKNFDYINLRFGNNIFYADR